MTVNGIDLIWCLVYNESGRQPNQYTRRSPSVRIYSIYIAQRSLQWPRILKIPLPGRGYIAAPQITVCGLAWGSLYGESFMIR